MRSYIFSISLLCVVSCKQTENDSSTVMYPIGDASEWLNSDENFGAKHRKGAKNSDSTETLFTLYADYNNDGIRDTAQAISYSNRHQTEIHFSCFPALVLNQFCDELQITDAGDLNGDGKHEILLLLQGSESCWDNLKLFSLGNTWIEKYTGITYQCVERPMYQFTKLNDKTIQITTFGESRDSIDAISGDTLEQVLPNLQRVHLINW